MGGGAEGRALDQGGGAEGWALDQGGNDIRTCNNKFCNQGTNTMYFLFIKINLSETQAWAVLCLVARNSSTEPCTFFYKDDLG